MNRYKREARRRFYSRFNNLTLVILTHWEDHEMGNSGTAAETLDTKAILNRLQESRWEPDLFDLRTLDDLKSAIGDTNDWDHTQAMTQPEYRKWKQERERRRLEEAAAQICNRHNVSIGTPEFLDACAREMESEQIFREGQEEDGLCAGWGISVDQYFDDRNYSRSIESRVQEVLDFCRRETPLLWALWQEQRLQERSHAR